MPVMVVSGDCWRVVAGVVPEPHDAGVVGLGTGQLQFGLLGEKRLARSDGDGMGLEDVLVDESEPGEQPKEPLDEG